MTRHLTEDEFVVHYYGEMSEEDERRAAAHLSDCRECHAQYRTLQRVLAVVDQTVRSEAELPAHFDWTVWARLEPELQRDRPRLFSWLARPPARLAWAAVLVLLVAAGFVVGRISSPPPERPVSTARAAASIREGILLADLTEHLDQTQMMLVELASAETADTLDVSRERERAAHLVAANRLYRQTATATGESAILDFLEDLERLLVDLAASPEELSAAELASVRRRMDGQDVLFKLRVLATAVRERQKSAIEAREGARSTT